MKKILILLSTVLISCNSNNNNVSEKSEPKTTWNLQDKIVIFDDGGYKIYRIWDKTSNSYVFVGTSNTNISIATR